MSPFDFGALGFWIFLAAIVVGGMWKESRQKAEKHETLRRIFEKTGTLDEAQMKVLFDEKAAAESKPGAGYRALRIWGTIVMFIAAGLFTFFLVAAGVVSLYGRLQLFSSFAGMVGAFAACAGIAVFGYGLHFASRFAEPPPASRNEPPAH